MIRASGIESGAEGGDAGKEGSSGGVRRLISALKQVMWLVWSLVMVDMWNLANVVGDTYANSSEPAYSGSFLCKIRGGSTRRTYELLLKEEFPVLSIAVTLPLGGLSGIKGC